MALHVSREEQEALGAALRIGLINNMGELAFEATERQFVDLLERASKRVLGGRELSLSLYTLRGTLAAGRTGYRIFEPDQEAQLDGLIVTGREPHTAHLRDEAYWASFTEVVDWAREHTWSTVWSCLAAHAAVLHLDDIGRVRREEKLSGVFSCTRVAEHELTEDVATLSVPHSRWNGLPEEHLQAAGYRILTRTEGEGVDAFLRETGSLFVFFQGHPEYGTDSLLREYRRDVGRYLRGQAAAYPSIPRSYFSPQTELALDDLRGDIEGSAEASRGTAPLERLAGVLEQHPVGNTWQQAAAAVYGNWLKYIAARKDLARPVDMEPLDCVVVS
jgi:homoserine O-succinyltransferase